VIGVGVIVGRVMVVVVAGNQRREFGDVGKAVLLARTLWGGCTHHRRRNRRGKR
jgi:hypothetical protein